MSSSSVPNTTLTSGGGDSTAEKRGASNSALRARQGPRKPKHAKGARGVQVTDPAAVVRYGELTQAEAEKVWKEACISWGYTETDTGDRLELRERVAVALAVSTSKSEENVMTRFTLDGSTYHTLQAIVEAARTISPGYNDSYLRMFVRSYDYAYFACAIVDILSDPTNVELRTDVAVRSSGPIEDAYLMCDVFPATYTLGGRTYSASELARHSYYRSNRASEAAANGRDIGLPAAANDTSATKRITSEPVVTAPHKVSQVARAGFMPVDPRA